MLVMCVSVILIVPANMRTVCLYGQRSQKAAVSMSVLVARYTAELAFCCCRCKHSQAVIPVSLAAGVASAG